MKKTLLRIRTLLCAGVFMLTTAVAQAQLRVEISGVGTNQIPISVAIFANEDTAGQSISTIIRADLMRSGVFRVVNNGDVISETTPVNLARWRDKGVDALVVGSVVKLADERLDIGYKLIDTIKGSELSSFRLTVPTSFARLGAHRIADDIFEKLTGIKSVFATRIAYVIKTAGEYRLEVADSDGENPMLAIRSPEPLISPVWSPDGSKLAYVSFEDKKPIVYIQDLATRQRIVAANFKGSNSAPAWSPDGSKLAIALSRDGLTQIYIVNSDGSNLRRLTNTAGIDTEPRFAPDGESVYFTSDRSGGPQIYRMNMKGGEARRVTFSGAYNISPRISPDGNLLAYISRREGRFQLFILDLNSMKETKLSDAARDESPSFAPNSRYLMIATGSGSNSTLAVVSTDGSTRYNLTTRTGDIREPAWGPFMK